jgi:hypothetical protein
MFNEQVGDVRNACAVEPPGLYTSTQAVTLAGNSVSRILMHRTVRPGSEPQPLSGMNSTLDSVFLC